LAAAGEFPPYLLHIEKDPNTQNGQKMARLLVSQPSPSFNDEIKDLITNSVDKKMSTAREIHVGTPAPDFPLKESITVHIHDFANLTTVRDEVVESSTFALAGFEWSLGIFPGGDDELGEGMIAVYLHNKSPTKVIV
jgi:hypothetical protein